MIKRTLIYSILLFLFITSPTAYAEDFDGSRDLICACRLVIQCGPDGECIEVMAEDIGIPDFLRIHFKERTISAPQWGENQPSSQIENLEHIDGKLILQGAENGMKDIRDGLGWSMAISEATGKMVLTGSSDPAAFVIFGACITK